MIKIKKYIMIFVLSFLLFQIKGYALTINVNDYIKESDSDATAGIKKAIEAADEGDTILIPQGEYIVSGRLYIQKSNITITGEVDNGENKSIIKCKDGTSNNWSVFIIQTNDSSNTNLNNITIKDLQINGNRMQRNTEEVNGNQYKENYGAGTGISILRSNQNYEISNILISNVVMNDVPGPSIQLTGKRVAHNVSVTDYEDVDRRSTDERYYVDNITIENCKLSNSTIGISQNTAKNVHIINNKIDKSLHENITIDLSDNCLCEGNELGEYFGGCGSIGVDNTLNSIIRNNKINNTNTTAGELFNSGITINSKAGISKNVIIEGNTIENANYGIFLKDHRGYVEEQFKLSNHKENYEYGSRPGEDFYILNNIIKNSIIYGIRVDELTGMAYLLNNNITSNQNVYNDYQDIYVDEYNYKKRGNESETIKNVIKGMIKELKINKLPDKLKYNQGENLDLTNGTFDVILDDDTIVNFKMNEEFVHISGFNRNSIEEQIIKLSFANKELTFKINQKEEIIIDNEPVTENNEEQKEVEVPETSKSRHNIIMILGTLLIIFAIFVIQKSNKIDNN